MGRSLKKGAFIHHSVAKKVQAALSTNDKTPIKTWSRSSTISPEMVGMKFQVHNGKTFIEVLVNENMVGHRLGEFAPTRKFSRHGGKMQKEQEKTATASK